MKGRDNMLKGIPANLSPDLVKCLMEMGHGDEIVLADANFPAAALAKRLVRCDGQNIPSILNSILRLFPLDVSVERPVCLMDAMGGEPPLFWTQYASIVERRHPRFAGFEHLERFEFYRRAERAFAVVATSEHARRGNIILKKGVVGEEDVRESD